MKDFDVDKELARTHLKAAGWLGTESTANPLNGHAIYIKDFHSDTLHVLGFSHEDLINTIVPDEITMKVLSELIIRLSRKLATGSINEEDKEMLLIGIITLIKMSMYGIWLKEDFKRMHLLVSVCVTREQCYILRLTLMKSTKTFIHRDVVEQSALDVYKHDETDNPELCLLELEQY